MGTALNIDTENPLPADRLERLDGWARSRYALSYVYRPTDLDGIRTVFALARRHDLSITLRGAGRSYGDAALGSEQIVLDLSRLNRILDWNPVTGIVEAEAGVTLAQLWEYVVGDGWWIPVVSGTMFVTLGGALAMNIHGKNNFRAGTLGEYVESFDLLTVDDNSQTVTPSGNSEIFYAVIGGMGLLGVVTSVKLRLKKIESGLVTLRRTASPDLESLFDRFEMLLGDADHAVGWIDGFARGKSLGRGLMETVKERAAGEDRLTAQSLRAERQRLPDTILGVVPKAILWRFLRPLFNNFGMRILNEAQFGMGRLGDGKTVLETHAGAAFKLDFVPDWKLAYGNEGLIQYQTWVPNENARAIFRRQLETCQKRGMVPYLAVLKRHRADPFLLSCLGDGWSLALDFKVTKQSRERMIALYDEMAIFTIAAGGKFYFAKDGFLRPERLESLRESSPFQKFATLKCRLDPENRLQTDLYRRLFSQ